MARQRVQQTPKEHKECRFLLARAYVELDWLYYCDSKNASAIQSSCEQVKRTLASTEGAPEALEALCDAGADEAELLWLLFGCQGIPVFANLRQVFGWPASELDKILRTIRDAATAIERMSRHTFGILGSHALCVKGDGLSETLNTYAAMAIAARDAFGHRSEWFLNLAKARLVIHVRSRTKGDLHDSEISELVSAIKWADSDGSSVYASTAQSRWRHTHAYLIADNSLDPWAAKSVIERSQDRRDMAEIIGIRIEGSKEKEIPSFDRIVASRSLRSRSKPQKG